MKQRMSAQIWSGAITTCLLFIPSEAFTGQSDNHCLVQQSGHMLMAQRNQIAIIRDMQMPQSLKLDKAAKS